MRSRAMIEALLRGESYALSRTITLCESLRPDKRRQGLEILAKAMAIRATQPQKPTIRLGISGPPGVGKSCLIEALGLALIRQPSNLNSIRIAVLSVDPTSPVSGGSILGDKTRMPLLAAHPQAFIRPSPSQLEAGGLSPRTKEIIHLCECAGYDMVIIETVGVGQSEIDFTHVADISLVLQQPYAGDELQGIKKGLLEIASLVAVTKADGAGSDAAFQTKRNLDAAFQLLPPNKRPPVLCVSSLSGKGIANLIETIFRLIEESRKDGRFIRLRQKQAWHWFQRELQVLLLERFKQNQGIESDHTTIRQQIESEAVPASYAALHYCQTNLRTQGKPQTLFL